MRARNWLGRVRERLAGAPEGPPTVGGRWSPTVATVWAEVEEQVDAQLKRPGSAAVSTWEVCAAELARRTIGEAEEAATLTRFSDALVPLLDALQGPHKALPAAIVAGRHAGESVGTLAAATRPLVLLPSGLDGEVEVAWHKVVAYLDPLFTGGGDPDGCRAVMSEVGPRLSRGVAEAEGTLREELSRLPSATDPLQGLLEPFGMWADQVARTLEVEVYTATRAMIRRVR
ncbi:MAG: hypothetical protein EXR71_15905 [Myxococcales bacterium]|nr:hypothetical protein [Myxococcales bacterium]